VTRWRKSKSNEIADREWWFNQLRAVDLLRKALTDYVDSGKFAAASLAQKELEGGPSGAEGT
jgi:hypothetical protein